LSHFTLFEEAKTNTQLLMMMYKPFLHYKVYAYCAP